MSIEIVVSVVGTNLSNGIFVFQHIVEALLDGECFQTLCERMDIARTIQQTKDE
jgi:hypothetical protein